jgi:hypothetical protein
MNNRAKYFEFFRLYFRIPIDDYCRKLIPFKNIPGELNWLFDDKSFSSRYLYYEHKVLNGTPFI